MTRLDIGLLRALPRQSAGRIQQQRFTLEAGGLYGTSELIPEGFLEDLKAMWAPDGYLLGAACVRFAYGMSCAGILRLLEAFPGLPLGLIVTDPDLAVVCAWEMLLDGAARHADAVGFVREFLAGGEPEWKAMEERTLARREALGLDLPGADARERLWEGLRQLKGLLADPAGAARQVDEWQSAQAEPGEAPAFWTSFVRVYEKLHALAATGRAVAVASSILDPDLLVAFAGMPGFAASIHVVYLSNAADVEARRILFAGGRERLGLSEEPPDLGSTPDLVAALNAALLPLGILSSSGRGACFVQTGESQGGVFSAAAEVPQIVPGDFFLKIDFNQIAFALFEAPLGDEDGLAVADGEPWCGAGAFRSAVMALFGAAVRLDWQATESAMARITRELSHLPLLPGGDPTYLAFRIAELAEALLIVRRNGGAASEMLWKLQEEVRSAVGQLASLRKESLLVEGGAMELFLYAHAFTTGGRLLADPDLVAAGRRFVEDGLKLNEDRDGSFGSGVEMLLRLLRCAIHEPQPRVEVAVRRGVAWLLAGVMPSREVPSSSDGAARGYAAYAQADDVVYNSARLVLLFHGLKVENLDSIRAAFLIRRGDSGAAATTREVAR